METRKIPLQGRAATLAPASVDKERRTVDLVWSSGAQVRRADWWSGQRYLEELSMDPAHVRLDRLNGGANLLDSHSSWSLRNILGVVEKAQLEGPNGTATVRFSPRADVTPIWEDVQAGIIRNVSVGYLVHRFQKIPPKRDGELEIWRAVDWEPMEISLVAVPADPAAGVRQLPEMACEFEDFPVAPATESRVSMEFARRRVALLERKLRRLSA